MPTLIQLYQLPWLIQDDTGLIQNCINRLKTFLCDTNLYHRVKNDTTLYQRILYKVLVIQKCINGFKMIQKCINGFKMIQKCINGF